MVIAVAKETVKDTTMTADAGDIADEGQDEEKEHSTVLK